MVAYLFIIKPAWNLLSGAWQLAQIKLPEAAGRTNFLVLGVGGGSHEGADLTDSMAVVSVKSDPPDVAVISIPRDLWVVSLRAKINSMYHYGEEKQPQGGGFLLAKSAVSEVVGQPIHYAVMIDFSGFEKIIDALGGIDVNVEQVFEDKQFPIAGREQDLCDGDPEYKCRFETVKFDTGIQHMDGKTALKFVRSRHAEGDEGSDFARSKRQEQVVKALRQKVISTEVLSNPTRLSKLYELVQLAVKTDITPDLYPATVKLGLKVYKSGLRTTVLSEPDLLYNPPLSPLFDHQWVLLPRNDDPKIIADYVDKFINP